MEEKEQRIRACSYCGSTRIEPKILFGGPMAQLDHKDGKYWCLDCGKESVPLDFHSSYEVQDFRESAESQTQDLPVEDFLRVPIVPLNTGPLFRMGPMELPIGKVARVVNVNWNENRLEPLEFSVPFLDYWRAVSGKRYNAREMFLMDLSGMNDGKPNFMALKKLIKHRYEMWLDIGIRDVQDLFDSFAMDISWAVAGTLSCPSTKLFEEIFDLSDRCVPCIYIDREVRWDRSDAGPTDLGRLVRFLFDTGFERLAIIDLPRLGKREGYSEHLVDYLEGYEGEILIGGGVRETDFETLQERGFKGALVDPFTPVIESIIEEPEDAEPTEDSMPSSDYSERRMPEALPHH
ncbi:MAG: hypothetical protein GKC03_04945 [Methanomassiliicoccales archaeon]|nr:hypothetical protein [Methanomassiliicoccales archaeon]NYT16280.1 hypothetical protein [Methanomassiliicoccales archaeon]